MTAPTLFSITQPGGYSAKNTRRVGAPNNHQGSGETSMVGTTPTADSTTVTEIRNQLHADAERFVQYDHTSGSVIVHFDALAVLVAEIVTDRTHVALAETRADMDMLRAERDAFGRMLRSRGARVIRSSDLRSEGGVA